MAAAATPTSAVMLPGEAKIALHYIGEFLGGAYFKNDVLGAFVKTYSNEFYHRQKKVGSPRLVSPRLAPGASPREWPMVRKVVEDTGALCHSMLFDEFQALIERELETHLKGQRIDVQGLEIALSSKNVFKQLYRQVSKVIDELAKYADFDYFVNLMRSANEEASAEVQQGDLPSDAIKDLKNVTAAVDEGMNGGWIEIVREFDESQVHQLVNPSGGAKLAGDIKAVKAMTELQPIYQVDMKKSWDKSAPAMIRSSLQLDLSPRCAAVMLMRLNDRTIHPTNVTQHVKVLKDYGPWDKIYDVFIKVPLSLKQKGEYPGSVPIRVTMIENWPNVGEYGYRYAPFDVERNVPIREAHPMQMRLGVIMRKGSEKQKCTLVCLDEAFVGDAPKAILASIFSSCSKSIMFDMVKKFKKTDEYKQWEPLDLVPEIDQTRKPDEVLRPSPKSSPRGEEMVKSWGEKWKAKKEQEAQMPLNVDDDEDEEWPPRPPSSVKQPSKELSEQPSKELSEQRTTSQPTEQAKDGTLKAEVRTTSQPIEQTKDGTLKNEPWTMSQPTEQAKDGAQKIGVRRIEAEKQQPQHHAKPVGPSGQRRSFIKIPAKSASSASPPTK